jgi:hypothetical protein
MLAKLHALRATGGLPIYDSRVAAAIATLAQRWRFDANLPATRLPTELIFPAADRRRTVLCKFPNAESPGVIALCRLLTPNFCLARP